MRTARLPRRPTGRRALLDSLLGAAMLVAVLALTVAPAVGDVGETIILRCTHGQSLSGFSQSAYSRALKELSADAEEYTDCSQLIRQAQAAAAGGGAGSGGGAGQGGATPTAVAATPSEQRSIESAASAGGSPVSVEGQVIHPGVVHASIASALSSLPTPLLAVLVLLLAGLAVFAGGTLRNRVRDRSSD